jgi:D-methionine transport system permease protein
MFSREMTALMAQGLWETLYMTVLSTAAAYALGLPVGLLLVVTDKDGIRPGAAVNRIVGSIVTPALVPFIILLSLCCADRFLVGTPSARPHNVRWSLPRPPSWPAWSRAP